ncbi:MULTISPECIES: hypothetical protein [Rhodomicrobium]|uniref:hypothetical protein n=1 Tax=Rhodomicrobium TaxID=1068 RepID=UPI000B4AA813|nr:MULTISPECIES: hypothetical protein [Rhodomicrobium]
MPQARGKGPANKGGYDPAAIIHSFTDSVERIGEDVALYGMIVVLAFVALMVGANAGVTFLLSGCFIAGWLGLKWNRMLIAERLFRLELARMKEERGLQLLRLRERSPEQLSMLDGDDRE